MTKVALKIIRAAGVRSTPPPRTKAHEKTLDSAGVALVRCCLRRHIWDG